MHTLILTCAGTSTRFPNMRPKWTLTHPTGKLMAVAALDGLSGYDRIIVALRDEHLERFPMDAVAAEFAHYGYDVECVPVGNTDSHVSTVCEALQRCAVQGTFTARDCDSGFRHALPTVTSVAVADLRTCGAVAAAGKGFIAVSGEHVRALEEDDVLSPLFLAGAYTFRSAEQFLGYSPQARRLSTVLSRMVAAGEPCAWAEVEGYADWNTREAWMQWCSRWCTLFVDIDGVLTTCGHRTFTPRWQDTQPHTGNIAALNALFDRGTVHVVLTTARPEALREWTEHQLTDLRYHRLIMGLPHARRLLVNDYVPSRGAFTAHAVNTIRDSADLQLALQRAGLR